MTQESPRPTYKSIEDDTREEVSGGASEKISRLIGANSQITIAEMADSIGVSTHSIERNLETLQKRGKLKRISPAKGWLLESG